MFHSCIKTHLRIIVFNLKPHLIYHILNYAFIKAKAGFHFYVITLLIN